MLPERVVIGTISHGSATSTMPLKVGCIMKLTVGFIRQTQVPGTFGSTMPAWVGSGQGPSTTMNLQPLKPSIYIPQRTRAGSTSRPVTARESFTGIPTPNG